MATNDFLAAEAHERRRVAVVAGLAALLTAVAAVIGVIISGDQPDNLPGALLFRNDHRVGLAVSAVLALLGSLGIAYVLDFLYRATRNRSARALQSWVRPLPWVGGIGIAVLGIVIQVIANVKLSHFASSGTQTYEEAREVLTASDYSIPQYLAIVPQMLLAFGMIMISLGAMRVGLLTRFMGYLGVIGAALFVLPLVPLPIVQIYWLAMLALLIWGLNKTREPPAWSTGEAQPWPSAAEVREQRVRAAEAKRGGGTVATAEPAALATGSDADDADADAEQSLGAGPSARRKRKKRR